MLIIANFGSEFEVYETLVLTTSLYNTETWTVKKYKKADGMYLNELSEEN